MNFVLISITSCFGDPFSLHLFAIDLDTQINYCKGIHLKSAWPLVDCHSFPGFEMMQLGRGRLVGLSLLFHFPLFFSFW